MRVSPDGIDDCPERILECVTGEGGGRLTLKVQGRDQAGEPAFVSVTIGGGVGQLMHEDCRRLYRVIDDR